MDFFSKLVKFLNLSEVDIISRSNVGKSRNEIYSIIEKEDATACLSSFNDFSNIINFLENNLLHDNKKILIYGDYDVDGLTSTSILYMTLKLLGFSNVEFYIPTRYETGYGLNQKIIEDKVSEGFNFIIAVDNGITKRKECEYLRKNNISYLILDHHEEQKGTLPIFDSNGAMYHRNDVSAGYLALIVSHSILEDKNFIAKLIERGNKIAKDEYLNYFKLYFESLACLAVFSDCMSLVNNNNLALARIGLRNINDNYKHDKFSYFSRLTKLIDNFDFSRQVTYRDINFSIVSKLNSIARIHGGENTLKGVFFLVSSNQSEINDIFEFINKCNSEKKILIKETLNKNQAINYANFDLLDYSDSDVPSGLSGLIANSYLNANNLKKVILVLCRSKINSKEIIGSLRGFEGSKLDKVLESPFIKPFLKDHGGHEAACGFTLPYDLKLSFLEALENELKNIEVNEVKTLEITVDDIDISSLNAIKLLEPFGNGFPFPKCHIYLRKDYLMKHVSNDHIFITVNNFHGKITLFNQVKKVMNSNSEVIKVTGTLDENIYNGKITCQFIGTI